MFIALITLHTQLEQNHNHETEKRAQNSKNICEWKFVRREIFAVQFHFIAGEERKRRYMRCDNKSSGFFNA